MALENEKLLDEIGWQILAALQENARLSYAELGRQVGLSTPAVAERVRRLEEAGVIKGYYTEIGAEKAGIALMAFVQLNTPADKYPFVLPLFKSMPEVLECHHVTGGTSFIIKIVAVSIPHLEALIERLSSYGTTSTSIVLSSIPTKPLPLNLKYEA